MDSKIFNFLMGGIISVLMVAILQEVNQLKSQNAYQQGTIDNQKLWLEHEKRGF